MSNYLVMLENHLKPEQVRILQAVQDAAAAAGCNVFLTGNAMRDVFAGSAVREMEFVVEGSATKLARTLEGATDIAADETWKQATVWFGPSSEIVMMAARQERYAKPGGRPQITLSGIQEHLRNRDFTINTIAISLAKSSKGLLLDPNNGISDLQHKELRAVTNYALYDQPIRLFQLIRLKAQLGFAVAEKTQMQYQNAREGDLLKTIPAEALLKEIRYAAGDQNAGAIVEAWASENLLARISPALSGAKLNVAGFAKLAKARQAIPFETEIAVDDLALFLWVLAEKLTPKERSELVDALALPKEEVEAWHKLEARSGRVAKELEAAARPSKVYGVLSQVPAERAIFLLMSHSGRTVHERIRNYFAKYLPAALELTDEEVTATGAKPGTPKWQKARATMIAKKLDARPKKVEPVEPPPEPQPPVRANTRIV